ncbi:3-galactosyl-N-acetylglucosaminide 4-alpha-L-fucosyltransferase FUT3-like isoform X1 [Styela clava]
MSCQTPIAKLKLSLFERRKEYKKVHRMTKHFRPRHNSWKTRHIVALSLVGFVWYTLVSKWSPTEDKSSLIRKLQGLKPVFSQKSSKSTMMTSTTTATKTTLRAIQKPSVLEKQKSDKSPKLVPPKQKSRNKDEDADPFNRKKLNMNNDPKLAELIPVEAPGRRTRPKLGGFLTPPPMTKKPPIILVWKAMEHQMKHYKEDLEFYFGEECGGCQLTTNRALAKECAALVHFNSPDLRKLMDVPDNSTRNPDQFYVFWSRETPAKTYSFRNVLQDKRFDPIFNLTINFRRDADIVDYFGNREYELRFYREKERDTDNKWFERLLKKKNGLAVWAVSNCNSTYGATERMKYAKSLMKAGLKLTAFGQCFGKRPTGGEMLQQLMRHKFYMSLENSIHCPDYVSEKFWRNGLRAGAVPVVWGPSREDIAEIAPKHSYIHSEDFETPEKLVKYLNYLDKNQTAYLEYHAWRFKPIDDSIPEEDIIPTYRSSLCRLCKKINERPIVRKTIASVYDWLYETRYPDDLCFR